MILKPLTEVYPTTFHFNPNNERGGIIDRIKQDNVDYRGIPDERVNTAIQKIQEAYYVDESKLKNYIPDYNTTKKLLDMYV